MREFVLNDVSASAAASRNDAVNQLEGVVRAAARLVHQRCAIAVLRAKAPLMEISCSAEATFWECMQDLRARPSARDEALFLLRMATKCPLQFELPSCHSERFWGVGVVTDCRSSIEPLVLCAVMNSVSMSLPSDAFWDVDSISVDFNEINSHGDVERITEVVDNIADEGHAEPVAWRMRAGVQAELDRATFWDRRSMAFPNLVFAPGTQQHVEGGRTHLRLDNEQHVLEIGYVGAHLPLG